MEGNEQTFIKEQVLDAIKKYWIKEFGKISDGEERDGYFVSGFVRCAIEVYLENKENESEQKN